MAGVTAKAPAVAVSCVMSSRKPSLDTSRPFPVHRVARLSAVDWTLVFTSHVRFMMCHRVSAGDVYVVVGASSSPQNT